MRDERISLIELVILSFFAFVLQIYFVPFIEITSWRPNLILLMVLLIGHRSGPVYGTIVGFAFGVLQDGLGAGTLGMTAMANSLAGFFAGYTGPLKLTVNGKTLAAIVLILFHGIIYIAFYQFKTEATFLTLLFTRVFPNTIYTFTIGMVSALLLKNRAKGLV